MKQSFVLMKSCLCLQKFLRVSGLPAIALVALTSAFAAPANIFFTQFEPGQGYSTNLDLIGQGGWLGEGSGGNGIVNNFIPGQGQQAYIGYSAPAAGDDQLVAWQPLNFNPLAASQPIVKFSVLTSIEDSTNDNFDNFRWSVYNSQVDRLFSLDFDNYYTNVSYLLDGTNALVATGVSFAPGSNYTLLVTMNFAANRWSATLNNALLATNQLITTTGAALNLGDIDAVWLVYDTNAPGDNFMLFDNYHVTAEAPPVTSAQMQFLGRTLEGWTLLRVFGSDGSRWAVEGTTNLLNWSALKTNLVTGSYFDLVDTTAVGLKQRLYRARRVP
jgi:hypothetical protein